MNSKMGAFSPQTIAALTEVVTGGSGGAPTQPIGIYRSGPKLEQFLGTLNLDLQIGASSRVPAVRTLLTETNRKPDGQETIGRVIEAVVDIRDFLENPDRLLTVVDYMNKRLSYDKFQLRKRGQQYRLISVAADSQITESLREKVKDLELDSVQHDFERAVEQAEADPEGAITSACSTIESVCKCLLDHMKKPYPNKQDVGHLAAEVQRHLKLSPDRPDVEEDVRRILGGFSNVSAGIGALRTHAGDAHGRGRKVARVDSRIARLAIHSASTVALFLIETWQEKKQL